MIWLLDLGNSRLKVAPWRPGTGLGDWSPEEFWNAQPGLSFATLMEQRRLAFAIVHSEGQWFGPLRLGDTARVVMVLERLTKRSLTWRFSLFRGETDERPFRRRSPKAIDSGSAERGSDRTVRR